MCKQLYVLVLAGAASLMCAPSARAQDIDRLTECCAAGPDATAAVVDGESIKFRDLAGYSRTAEPRRLFLLNQQLQDARRGLLDSLSDERLLEAEAARAGTTVSELLNHLKVEPVTDAEILHTFKQIKEQQPAVTYKQMLPVLRMYLQGRHRADAKARFFVGLKQAAR